METTEKNRFSILLDQLINTGEVKNASLAAALRYDASYISKWITGRMIPAEKTKRKVLRGISQEIVRQSTQSGLENLCADYQISDCEELKTVIYDHLESEYNYVLELQKTYGNTHCTEDELFYVIKSGTVYCKNASSGSQACETVKYYSGNGSAGIKP